MVYGVQQYRKDGFFRRLTSNLFYWVFEHLTGIRDLQNMRILRIMTRRFVHAYLSFGDFHLFVAGVNHRAGFQKERLLVDKTYKGHSSYTFQKRLLMASNAILSFSTQPLYYMFAFSFVAAVILFVTAIGVIIWRLFDANFQAGWLSPIISIWLVGAVIINCTAVIGLYVAKVFEQVKGRPRFVIRQIYSSEQKI